MRFLASQDGGLPGPSQSGGGGEDPAGYISMWPLQPRPVQMLAQRVETCGGEDLIAFWDSGSQITVLTHRKAAAACLMPEPAAPLIVKGFKSEEVLLEMGYHVPRRTKDGEMHTLFAYSVDDIVKDVNSSLDREAAAAFPQVEWEDVKGMAGHVDLLLGFNNMGCFLVEADRKGSLALWSSQLGTGWMIADRLQQSCTCESCTCTVVTNMVAVEHFQPLDFIKVEALGTNTPARCAACRNCRECKFRVDSISFKENKEYKVIINRLKMDVEKKKWIASYPFCVSPWVLINNYKQARSKIF